VSHKRSPNSDMKDTCIKQCLRWSSLCKQVFIDCRCC